MYGDLRPEREDAYVEEHGQNKRQKTGDDDDDGGVATKNDVATKKDGTHLSFPLFNHNKATKAAPKNMWGRNWKVCAPKPPDPPVLAPPKLGGGR